jgi:hypothetical protein
MVQRRQRERSLFEVLLPDGHKLWPDWLRTIDTVLEDAAVIETTSPQVRPRLQRAQGRLQAMRPLVQRVSTKRGRTFRVVTPAFPDKVLSIFEPHTETIRKDKIAAPNEFGKLVTIQESEHQIITEYNVLSPNVQMRPLRNV